MEIFGKLCFALITIILSSLIGGFVFMTLWRWFVSTTFDIQGLSLIQSIGLITFWSYVKPKPKEENKDKKATEIFGKALLEVVMYAAIALSFGWIIHLFI